MNGFFLLPISEEKSYIAHWKWHQISASEAAQNSLKLILIKIATKNTKEQTFFVFRSCGWHFIGLNETKFQESFL